MSSPTLYGESRNIQIVCCFQIGGASRNLSPPWYQGQIGGFGALGSSGQCLSPFSSLGSIPLSVRLAEGRAFSCRDSI